MLLKVEMFSQVLLDQFTTKYEMKNVFEQGNRLLYNFSRFTNLLIQEERVVSYWRKNGHFILVNCLWKACPGTVRLTK